MIPKIAHFHWRGKPMNWLRWASIRTFEKYHPDWEIRIIRTPEDIQAHGLVYGQEADWSWWRALYETGGFQVATDIVFVKRIPDEWLDYDLNCCMFEMNRAVHQFAVMGAVPGLGWIGDLDRKCSEMASGGLDYQAMGVKILTGIPGGVRIFDQEMNAFCPVDCSHIPSLWDDCSLDLTPETIGVHWYGGHELSKALEWDENAEKHAILRLARNHV